MNDMRDVARAILYLLIIIILGEIMLGLPDILVRLGRLPFPTMRASRQFADDNLWTCAGEGPHPGEIGGGHARVYDIKSDPPPKSPGWGPSVSYLSAASSRAIVPSSRWPGRQMAKSAPAAVSL